LLSLVIGNLHTDKLANSPRNVPNRTARPPQLPHCVVKTGFSQFVMWR